MRTRAALFCAVVLAACVEAGGSGERALPALGAAEISHDAEGRCWGRDIAPAVVQTVTAQEIATPAVLAGDGTILTPATWRTTVRQEILRERGEQAFETVCPPVYTAGFVESLQRALGARGYYRGAVDGVLDTATGRAVQDFQRSWGPDSPLLSIEAARRLGLVVLSPEELGAM